MCGLLGVISKKELPDFKSIYADTVNKALDSMSYRGPDNKGIWYDTRVCLGHRRLSIIDLSEHGNQPFFSRQGNHILVFNGEIYNYRELKDELSKEGFSFTSDSDTEVILKAYEQYGKDFCKKLRGMFALVIYDKDKNEVVFARDRMGKKPLFVYEDENVIAFSSEIKFFHAFKNLTLNIDTNSLLNYLSLQYIPGPETIYKSVRNIEPAEIRTYNLIENTSYCVKFWDLIELTGHQTPIPSLEEIDAALEKSVRYRLVANVDVGLLLSGGIDSSLLACYMENLAGKKVKTFNVGFADKSIDESLYAKQVANALGLELISLEVEDITPETFSDCIYHADQPLGDSAILPTYLIAKSISEHVKVVLSGEGADELFHGYNHYQYERAYRNVGKLPFIGVNNFIKVLSNAGFKIPDKFKIKFSNISALKEDIGSARWTTILSPELAKSYLNTTTSISYEKKFNSYLYAFEKNTGRYESSLLLDLVTYLPDDLLIKIDRSMMAHSVEARAPFLDQELIELVLRSSQSFKNNLFQSKNYLRQLLKKKLPDGIGNLISNRPKHGFETPKVAWLKSTLFDFASYLFSEENLKTCPFLHIQTVSHLWASFKSGKAVNEKFVWNLFCFLEWYRQHKNKFGF